MVAFPESGGSVKRRGVPPKQKALFDLRTFLTEIGEGRTVLTFRKNQVVFSQGDAADAAFYIQDGLVRLAVVSNAGKEVVFSVLGSGDFLGEECLADRRVRLASAIAMSECSILRLEKSNLIRVLRNEPAFSSMFVSYLISRTIRIEADLVDQLFNASEKRLARALLLLANLGKEDKSESVMAKITQETLAEMIGTTRSRVNFFMNKFRKMGFIDYKSGHGGRLEVRSALLNMVLHD